MNQLIEIRSTEHKQIVQFSDLLSGFKTRWDETIVNYLLKIPTNSSIYECIKIVEDIVSRLSDKDRMDQYLVSDAIKWRATSSLVLMYELDFIFSNLSIFKDKDRNLLREKLNEIVRLPLLTMDENINNNQGRNTLFELRLYVRLAKAGYDTSLNIHPDILVKINGREYAIECKRIFSENSLIRNILDAREQLRKHSLNSRNQLGIIAISMTRSIHTGNRKLVTETIEQASAIASSKMNNVYQKYESEIRRNLNYKFPAILFDYSDIAEINIPYWVNKIHLYKLVDSNRVYNDLELLSNQ